MRIGIIGYGKMGIQIHTSAEKRGHEVILRAGKGWLEDPDAQLMGLEADVLIDFSHPSSVYTHAQWALTHQIPLVIGTTGWDEDRQRVASLFCNQKIGCLASPNFSVGVALFRSIIAYAGQLFSRFPQYDVSGIELHHQHKKDCPSGTALALARSLSSFYPDKEQVTFASVRCGGIIGTHTLLFDGPQDRLTLTHEANSRTSFAEGAVTAAEWLINKQGFFTMEDWMNSLGITL